MVLVNLLMVVAFVLVLCLGTGWYISKDKDELDEIKKLLKDEEDEKVDVMLVHDDFMPLPIPVEMIETKDVKKKKRTKKTTK